MAMRRGPTKLDTRENPFTQAGGRDGGRSVRTARKSPRVETCGLLAGFGVLRGVKGCGGVPQRR